MDIYTKVDNLEKLVNSLIKTINKSKYYTDADIAGVRQNVSEITPYKKTNVCFIGDTRTIFENAPEGGITIAFDKPVENYSIFKDGNTITVRFQALDDVTEVTISII